MALDDLPADRVEAALDMLRALREGRAFFAPLGSREGLAVVDLVRLGLAEFAPDQSDHVHLAVRARPPATSPRRVPGRDA